MMKKKVGFIPGLLIGILVGATMFGGLVAYASGIMAQPKTAAIVIDGEAVDLKGYLVEGNHYFQLRDLAEKLEPGGKDFSIVWDGPGNRVLIDTSRGYNADEQYTPEAAATPTEPVEDPAMTIDEMKAEIVRLTNAERVKAGLPELEVLPELMDCAQAKAQDFMDNHYYGHNSPVYGTPGKMISSFVPNSRGSGENIAPWTKTPEEAFAGWVISSGHMDNILEPRFTHIGIGIVEGVDGGYWWVQHFATL